MAYYRKNKRRFDPRYFMNERLEEEGLEEMQVGDGSFKRVADGDKKEFHPETIRQRLDRAYAQKAAADEEEAFHHVAAGADEQSEIDDRNRKFNAAGSKKELEEGCGTEQTYFVDIGIGRAEFDDLNALIQTAQTWQKSGIDIVDASPEVLKALGIEVGASEPLPSLMDEEPPLEE